SSAKIGQFFYEGLMTSPRTAIGGRYGIRSCQFCGAATRAIQTERGLHLEEAMFRASFFATVLCASAVCGPAFAIGLGEAGELEHARANARAGGPLSDRDAELLQRYGCLSGTN